MSFPIDTISFALAFTLSSFFSLLNPIKMFPVAFSSVVPFNTCLFPNTIEFKVFSRLLYLPLIYHI